MRREAEVPRPERGWEQRERRLVELADEIAQAETSGVLEILRPLVARLVEDIHADVREIDAQLTTARHEAAVDGVYADPDWFHRTKHALRAAKRRTQRAQGLFSQIKARRQVMHVRRHAALTDLHPELVVQMSDLWLQHNSHDPRVGMVSAVRTSYAKATNAY